MNNPFNPSFGRIPEILLNRGQLIDEITDELDNPNSPYKVSIVYGMRGVGKTTFLTEVGHRMARKSNWLVVDLAMESDLLATLIDNLYIKANSKLKKVFAAISGLSFSAFGLQLSANIQHTLSTYQGILTQMFARLKENGTKVLITIDEVKTTKELKNFASYYQLLNREDYPVALMMTGLPENISELQNEDVLTFLLRGKRIALSSLDLAQIKLSYQHVFEQASYSVQPGALTKMAVMTKGYSYAFQLLGYLVWKQAQASGAINQDLLTKVKPEYLVELGQNVYSKIFDSLSKQDRKFLYAMAANKQTKVLISDIRRRLHKPSNYVANYRRRLLDDQVIQAAGYGEVAFTLPYFREYVLQRKQFEQEML